MDDEAYAVRDQSASVTTASQESEISPNMSQAGGSSPDETQRGTAVPTQNLALDFERQHRQYFPEALQHHSQSVWASQEQEIKFENGEEYSISRIQHAEARPSRRSAQIGHEYNNEHLPSAWTTESQSCLQALPWRPLPLSQDTVHRRPPLTYRSDDFDLNTTMADDRTGSELPAYATTVADFKPHYHIPHSSYTDLATTASVYPYYQTSSDGISNPSLTGPPVDHVLAFPEEADQLLYSGRESTTTDMDPEDVEMCAHDMKYEETGSPSTVDPSNDKNEPPYAKLIWQAFMSTPSRSMHLQQIYEWFRQNTDKANGDGKGWMNSIRHNLSMNKVKIPIIIKTSIYSYQLKP